MSVELGDVPRVLTAEAAAGTGGGPGDDALDALRRAGVASLPVPADDGGAGLGRTAANEVATALARVDAWTAVVVFLHYAAVSWIIHWGTPEQRKRLLTAVVDDDMIFASSRSEPGAGAAEQHTATRARPHDDGWLLEGAKSFTTGAGVAELCLVLASSADTPAVISHPHVLGLTLGAVAPGIAESAQELAGSTAFSRSHSLNRLAQDARAVTLTGPPDHLCRELVMR